MEINHSLQLIMGPSTSMAQYAEWDLKKTSNTLTETLIGLFLMA